MRNTLLITGIPIDKVTMLGAVETLKFFLSEDKIHTIYTPNAEIMMSAQKNIELRKVLLEGDMVIPDGAGVVLASKIIGNALPEKVSGIDLVRNSFSIKLDRKIRYFFFGSSLGIAEKAGENIAQQYSNVEIVGFRNGFFCEEDEPEIINKINSANADILLVALGSPKQELWIDKHKNSLNCKVCIGVGGSLDVFSGNVKPAPEFLRRNGFEWLFRLYKEPRRLRRMLRLPKYIFLAASYRFKK